MRAGKDDGKDSGRIQWEGETQMEPYGGRQGSNGCSEKGE